METSICMWWCWTTNKNPAVLQINPFSLWPVFELQLCSGQLYRPVTFHQNFSGGGHYTPPPGIKLIMCFLKLLFYYLRGYCLKIQIYFLSFYCTRGRSLYYTPVLFTLYSEWTLCLWRLQRRKLNIHIKGEIFSNISLLFTIQIQINKYDLFSNFKPLHFCDSTPLSVRLIIRLTSKRGTHRAVVKEALAAGGSI